MSYRLELYTQRWEEAARRCNARLQATGKAPFALPDQANSEPRPGPVQRQHWLAVGAEDEVHGGCLLQTQPAWVEGELVEVVNIQSPLSEGLGDRRHAGLAVWMIREVLGRNPFAYSVGMGGADMPYPRLLQALRWRIFPVPFYFRILSGRRFLANLQPLRRHPRFGLGAKIGGLVPLVPELVFWLIHRFRARGSARQSPPVGDADWLRVRERYGFAIDRSPEMLDVLYSREDRRFERLRVPGAWGVMRCSAFREHPYFGNLSVATLVEAICEPGAERVLIDAATKLAAEKGMDLVITNQAAEELISALESAGWLSYASNMLAAFSPKLAARMGGHPIYLNRGDGDGLLNL